MIILVTLINILINLVLVLPGLHIHYGQSRFEGSLEIEVGNVCNLLAVQFKFSLVIEQIL